MTLAPVLAGPVTRTGAVRPFVEKDIPRVARLHEAVFKPDGRREPDALDRYHAYFRRVFLHNPSRTAALPSLVHQEDDGRVTGFLGVVPRRMTMSGQPFLAAISSQFVVDPSSRVGFVAVRLAKAFLEGPQDISISDEGNDVVRRLWEGLGGTTSLLHSVYWIRPLRPAGLLLWLLRNRRRGFAPFAVTASPLAAIADSFATRMPRSPLCRVTPRGAAEELSEETFLTHLPDLAGAESLRADYDRRTLRWLLERARQRKPGGRLQTTAIRDEQKLIGWYVYHLDRDRVADVLQIAATASSIQQVLDHLFHQAGEQGAIAVAGRLDPRFIQPLSDNLCFFHRRGPWVLVDARKPELVRCFQTEGAIFSRLDGEWCLGF